MYNTVYTSVIRSHLHLNASIIVSSRYDISKVPPPSFFEAVPVPALPVGPGKSRGIASQLRSVAALNQEPFSSSPGRASSQQRGEGPGPLHTQPQPQIQPASEVVPHLSSAQFSSQISHLSLFDRVFVSRQPVSSDNGLWSCYC